MVGQDSLKTRRTLPVDGRSYEYYSLEAAAEALGDLTRLPFSLKVLLENLLRFEDDRTVTVDADARAGTGGPRTDDLVGPPAVQAGATGERRLGRR